MSPHQQRDLFHWKAFGRDDSWSQGWKDFHRPNGGHRARFDPAYRQGWTDAATLAAACKVVPKEVGR